MQVLQRPLAVSANGPSKDSVAPGTYQFSQLGGSQVVADFSGG